MTVWPNQLISDKSSSISVNIGTIGPSQGGLGEWATQENWISQGAAPYKGPVNLPTKATCPANIYPTYSDEWFERLHLLPVSADLGNVLVDVSGQFEIYNAFVDTSKIVTGQTSIGGAGITITPPGAGYPVSLDPLKSGTWLYDVSATNGPSKISAIFIYAVTGEEDLRFFMEGNRSVLFPFSCQRPMRESLEFKTQVIEARDGTEQRVMLRPEGRQSFDMEYLLSDPTAIATARNLIAGHSGTVFSVIMWQYSRPLLADLVATDTVIPVDTTFAEYRVGSQVVLWRDFDDFEIGTIDVVNPGSITVEQPLTGGHLASDTLVLPLQFCLASDPIRSERYENNVSSFTLKWDSADTDDYSDVLSLPEYGTPPAPIFVDPNFMASDKMREPYAAGFDTLDYNTGVFEAVARKATANPGSRKGWRPETAEELFAIRQFIYWSRGRLKTWWIPTFRQDFILADTINPSDTQITVENVKYSQLVGAAAAPYRDIYVILNDGTAFTFQINSSAQVGPVEVLFLDGSFGQTVTPADIRSISFLMKVRFNADTLTIKHEGQGRADIFAPIYGVSQ